ncbi:ComF family protein [Idiomarina aquatica]|uniref:ComF family protein n=1 Tax=Idiomarina aquatica TaxID=1327752 RepID=A0AA94EH99_9GAMM|nr:phosphoribosyltransferase family protein [Idiomarina aquatica]RUO45491.1 ComF family protein [Idiomarina aquatica]
MLASISGFANRIGANACILCRMHSVLEHGICDDCAVALPRWYPRSVKHLAHFPSLQERELTAHWFAPLRWTLLTQSLIYRYKTGGQVHLAGAFAAWLAAHLIHCYRNEQQSWPDVLVVVPTTAKVWQQRGFHHTGLLAQQLASYLKIPYQAGVLRVIRPLAKQKQLGRQQRWRQHAKSLHCTVDTSGLRVAVLDDLISSGATLTAAARALRKQGAKTVDGWALIYNQGD